MKPSTCLLMTIAVLTASPTVRGDAFDRYVNPVLKKAPGMDGVVEVKELTPALVADNDRVLPNMPGALVIIHTNDNRFSKLVVQSARQRVADRTLPILLIDRFATFKEGEERTIQADGKNVHLFDGFHFNLDLGQVVPAAVGGDVRFVAANGKVYAEPVGKAKMYLVTKALPGTEPKESTKLVIGETFEPRFFNGTYKLHDDGRRSGDLTLKVEADGEVTGAFYSDKDGRKYEVFGKIGSPKHSIHFTIKFPRTEESFQGWLFTGDGKALAGTARLQERETGFYAVRVEEK